LLGVSGGKAEEERLKYFHEITLADERNLFNSLLLSATGLKDKTSEKIREEFSKTAKDSEEKSIAALATDKSPLATEKIKKYFEKYKNKAVESDRKIYSRDLGNSIAGAKSRTSDEIRQYFEKNKYWDAYINSICGDRDLSLIVNRKR
jgi:hypothetical protein